MSNRKAPKNLNQLFDRLAESFAEDEAAEAFELSETEADQRLAERGIDPAPGLTKVNKVLERARAQSRLDKAQAQRQQYIQLFNQIREKLQKMTDPVKEEVLKVVEGISTDQADMVEAYFRKFEQSSEQDLLSLKHDLEMLRAMREMRNS